MVEAGTMWLHVSYGHAKVLALFSGGVLSSMVKDTT